VLLPAQPQSYTTNRKPSLLIGLGNRQAPNPIQWTIVATNVPKLRSWTSSRPLATANHQLLVARVLSKYSHLGEQPYHKQLINISTLSQSDPKGYSCYNIYITSQTLKSLTDRKGSPRHTTFKQTVDNKPPLRPPPNELLFDCLKQF
jgi:hypothetical protein